MSVLRGTCLIWCHICSQNREGLVNSRTSELECNMCNSSFVEKLGQGIEDFINPPVASTSNVDIDNEARFTESRNIPQQSQLNQQTRTDERSIETTVNQSSMNERTRPLGSRRTIIDILEALMGIPNPLRSEPSNSDFENILHHILMNEQSTRGVLPSSESVISRLPRKIADENEDLGECNITLEKFNTGDVCVCLPCGHRYKESEIIRWLGIHGNCPVCRISITEETVQ